MSLAERVNEWRIFPRFFSLLFSYLLWITHTWYTGLVDPTTEQSAYAAAMIAAGVGFFKLYVSSGEKRNGPN